MKSPPIGTQSLKEGGDFGAAFASLWPVLQLLWLSHCILHVAVTLSGSAVMTTLPSPGTGQTQIRVPGLAVSYLLAFLFPMNENGIVKSLLRGMKSLTKRTHATILSNIATCAPVCGRDALIM